MTSKVAAPNIRPISPNPFLSAIVAPVLLAVQRYCNARASGVFRQVGWKIRTVLVGRDFARQRIIGAFVKLANAVAVETLFFDFEIGAKQQFGRQFLDRKTDRFRSRRKSLVADGTARLAAAAGKEFGRGAVVDHRHNR